MLSGPVVVPLAVVLRPIAERAKGGGLSSAKTRMCKPSLASQPYFPPCAHRTQTPPTRGKGLVTIDRFLGCAESAITILVM